MIKFVSMQSISKQYTCLQNTIKRNHRTINALKLSITILIFILTVGVYGYFVNISSTKGYFLRKQMQYVEDAKFNHSITQLEILKTEKNVWDKIQTQITTNKPKDGVKENVIYIDIDKQLNQKLSAIINPKN